MISRVLVVLYTTSRHPTMSPGYKPNNRLLIKGNVVVVIVVAVAVLAFIGSGGTISTSCSNTIKDSI